MTIAIEHMRDAGVTHPFGPVPGLWILAISASPSKRTRGLVAEFIAVGCCPRQLARGVRAAPILSELGGSCGPWKLLTETVDNYVD